MGGVHLQRGCCELWRGTAPLCGGPARGGTPGSAGVGGEDLLIEIAFSQISAKTEILNVFPISTTITVQRCALFY